MSAKEYLRRAAATGVLALLLAVPGADAIAQEAPPPVPVGRALPDTVMSGLNGPSRPISSYRGKPLIVNVWASWCSPCRAEAASLERLAWGAAGSRYTVIGVSIDDYRDEALKWLKQSNATLSHYIDHKLKLEHMLGASSVPLTVLVDAQGRVVARYQGARQWDTAEAVKMVDRAFAAADRTAPKR